MFKKSFFFILFLFSFFVSNAFALNIDFINKNIWLSKENAIMLGDVITIYSMVLNNEDKQIGGEMLFIDTVTNSQVGNVTSFLLQGRGSTQVISMPWRAISGEHQFKAKIINAYEIVSGEKKLVPVDLVSSMTSKILVDSDEDKDGWLYSKEILAGTDPRKADTDGDTLIDSKDPNPLKKDADGDGDPDSTDPEPLNPNVKTPPDTDKDGIPDPKDTDKDNDGLYDWDEEKSGTDPLKYDTDGDGVGDKQDFYPKDSKRSIQEIPIKIELPKVNEKITFDMEEKSSVDIVKTENKKESVTQNKTDSAVDLSSEVGDGSILLKEVDEFLQKESSSQGFSDKESFRKGLDDFDENSILKESIDANEIEKVPTSNKLIVYAVSAVLTIFGSVFIFNKFRN